MANQQTGNYQLSQWESTDRIQMEDFNSDNAKIDAALKANADAIATKANASALAAKADASALTALAATAGNCKIVTGTYTGTGSYGNSNKNTLTFENPPMAVFVSATLGRQFAALKGSERTRALSHSSDQNDPVYLTWSGNSLSWYGNSATIQCNESGTVYRYVAFFA